MATVMRIWLVCSVLGVFVYAAVGCLGTPDYPLGVVEGGVDGGPPTRTNGETTDSGSAGTSTGGQLDSGSSDAGPTDSGFSIAGAVDAGSSDAGPTDSGSLGAGGKDSGTDAGSTGGTRPSPDAGRAVISPPLSTSGWTFYGAGQGLSTSPSDVSPDEGGNVYVAGGDAVYVKTRTAQTFLRAGPGVGLTTNCNQAETLMCPIISVAGGSAGQAIVGLQGIGTDDDNDPMWEQTSGGCDVLSFDGAKVQKTRHVLIASPPGVVTENAYTNLYGRRKGRQVFRVVYNHLAGLQRGDVWMAGTHVGFSVLLGNPIAEGWTDPPNQYPDSRGVWEHDHPAVELSDGSIETGDYYGVAIDPTTGDPWAGSEYRTASKRGYATASEGWWNPLWPAYNPNDQLKSYLDVWPDGSKYDIDNPAWKDNMEALAFCDDGTLYLGSSTLGMAVRTPTGQLTYLNLPPGLGNNVYALACDPSDHSVWVGFGWGGLGRLHPDGTWSLMPDNLAAPAFTQQPVRSIQIDRWTSPRIVYFAHLGPGGGVTAYAGP